MTFSPELEAKFDKLLKSYPPGRQRSAMIPMLLFAQDEVGSLTDEVIAEVASRIGVQPLQVEEVLSYYSMLHRKPLGKAHVQICTNISCMLRGGEDIAAYVEKRLGIKTGESTPDGRIFLKREEECLAACTGAPMMMVDHIYHEYLTHEKIDQILAELE